MKFLRQHAKLIALLVLSGISFVGLIHGKMEENLLVLVPQDIHQQIELFQQSPLSQKLIVVARSSVPARAVELAGQMREQLEREGLIQTPVLFEENTILTLLSALPSLFTEQVQQKTEQKFQNLSGQFSYYREQLFSFQSMFVKKLITQDPFCLTGILIEKWKQVGTETQLNFQDGFFQNEQGTVQAGLYEVKTETSDLAGADRIQKIFSAVQKTLPTHEKVFFMGGMRYALENASVIKHDLLYVSGAGFILLGMIFWYFFRTRQALFIYFLPVFVLPPAAWVTQLVFGSISGLTLGFGSVVAGLSVDYAIYIYMAFQSAPSDQKQIPSHLKKHLGCTFLTSALCFAALFFSSVELFKQIAVFALTALSVALLTALWIFPAYFNQIPATKKNLLPLKKGFPAFSFRTACWVTGMLVLFGVWGMMNLSFRTGMDSLNSTSADFKQDRQTVEDLFAADKKALLFALGRTEEEALLSNEQLSRNLSTPLAVSNLFVSSEIQRENQTRWNDFWSEARMKQAHFLLQKEARKAGFSAGAFEPFFTWLANKPETDLSDFYKWYNPVLRLSDGTYAVVNVVPDSPAYAQVAHTGPALFLSVTQLQKQLANAVKKEAVTVVICALVFNFLVLWMLFRQLKTTLFCFIPVFLGGCILFGGLALLQVQVNLFGLIFLPLLVGLGIDYGIFQLMKFRASATHLEQLYPSRALLAAGLSTIVGFGVLVLAQHSVLFIMGVCALLGIGGAVFVSLFILPAFWEHYA